MRGIFLLTLVATLLVAVSGPSVQAASEVTVMPSEDTTTSSVALKHDHQHPDEDADRQVHPSQPPSRWEQVKQYLAKQVPLAGAVGLTAVGSATMSSVIAAKTGMPMLAAAGIAAVASVPVMDALHRVGSAAVKKLCGIDDASCDGHDHAHSHVSNAAAANTATAVPFTPPCCVGCTTTSLLAANIDTSSGAQAACSRPGSHHKHAHGHAHGHSPGSASSGHSHKHSH